MSVYFVQREAGGLIKIGCSGCVPQRVYQLQIDLKAKLVVLATAPGSFREEGRLHRQFADVRIEGEWFEDCPAIRAAIDHVIMSGDLPPAIEEDRELVMASRYNAGDTLQCIADDFDMTRERVRQILRASGVPSLGMRERKQIPISDAEREVADVYAAGKTSPSEICVQYGVSHHRLKLILQRTGTKRYSAGHWAKHPEDASRTATVVALYNEGVNTTEIAKRVGLPHQTHVYRYLEKAGVKPERRGRGSEFLSPAIALFAKGLSGRSIAKELGCDPALINKALRKAGIRKHDPAKSHPQEKISLECAHAIRAAYTSGTTAVSLAAQHGVGCSAIFRALRRTRPTPALNSSGAMV